MNSGTTERIERLVAKFAAGVDYYTDVQGHYLEADVRGEFIDPLLRALGWDVENRDALIPSLREVIREESQQREGGANKRPDYTLRVGGIGKLYVEAKKPSVNILIDMDAIRQTRAYGWTKQHPIVVLTNFRHIRIFDTSVPIGPYDTTTTALRFECEYSDMVACLKTITLLIGRDAVREPNWLGQFSALAKAPLPADRRFVEQFNRWRVQLGRDLVTSNTTMTEDEVNDAVQRILNRLVFVRMCEDRGIEGEGVLRQAFEGSSTDVVDLFKRLNDRYNTGIFRSAGGTDDPVLQVNASTLKAIVENLYAPYSPFSFAVLDADFLGLVYEATLAQHLVIRGKGDGRTVLLNQKGEYAKRDVVTTPQALVDGTVRAAVDELDVELPRTLDFASGSGRFLLSVFDALVEREVLRRSALDKKPGLLKVADDTYRLSFEVKRDLLVDHIFGIDIDFNAVEVTRFSLLVRLLEDEVCATLPLRKRAILPNLGTNIAHGNTLVRNLPATAPAGAADITRPIELAHEGLPTSFDLVVGNPPYMSTEKMREYDRVEFDYIKANYTTPHQQFDKYFPFVEFAVDHLGENGVLGVVVPNKWMTTEAGTKFRSMLRSTVAVRGLTNFRHAQVFEDKQIYVCSLIAKKAKLVEFEYVEPDSIPAFVEGTGVHRTLTGRNLPKDLEGPWVLPADANEERILTSIHRDSLPLKLVVEARNGVQTSLNTVYVITNPKVTNGLVEFTKDGTSWSIEVDVTRRYLDDSTGVRSHSHVDADARIIYPYRPTSIAQNRSGYEVIGEDDMRKNYPLAYKYLEAHKPQMDKRHIPAGERAKAFYVYGRTQAIGYSTQAPKIFYSVNQRGEKYGLDTTGIVYQSGGTAGEVALYLRDTRYSLDYILALLDQRPIEFFLRKRGSAFRGGYFARGTAVINDVPIPCVDFTNPADVRFHNDIATGMVELRKLYAQTASISLRRKTQHQTKIDAITKQIADLFLSRWGLSKDIVAQLRL